LMRAPTQWNLRCALYDGGGNSRESRRHFRKVINPGTEVAGFIKTPTA
jgi:hypothetical protein